MTPLHFFMPVRDKSSKETKQTKLFFLYMCWILCECLTNCFNGTESKNMADKVNRATLGQNISIRIKVLPLQELCQVKNKYENPNQIQQQKHAAYPVITMEVLQAFKGSVSLIFAPREGDRQDVSLV